MMLNNVTENSKFLHSILFLLLRLSQYHALSVKPMDAFQISRVLRRRSRHSGVNLHNSEYKLYKLLFTPIAKEKILIVLLQVNKQGRIIKRLITEELETRSSVNYFCNLIAV